MTRGLVNKIGLSDVYESGFDSFAIPVLETAPSTIIQNRAKVSRSLKAIAGVERIMCRGLLRLANEFGPNGEQVFEADNKDARIRFIGGLWNSFSSTAGAAPVSANTGDILEITFYGTGLNLLSRAAGTLDFRPTIDGGSEGANIFTGSGGYSAILDGRNYGPNVPTSVTSGLALGWHTVRLRNAVTSSNLYIFGFEILNQRTDLAVYSGQGNYKGKTTGLDALAVSAFNAGVGGTRGARVVKYVSDGGLKTAVQEVDATSKFLTLADHTNEEVVRRINFREFGANRADDFSTLSGGATNRAFTLDDGTTTLVGNGLFGYADSFITNNAGSTSLTITFVGTGLDIVYKESIGAATGWNGGISIDGGASVGVGPSVAVGQQSTQAKICSGLPYGTHTVRFSITGGALSPGFQDFIIYQPKKPAFEGVQVADYNVMANYTQASSGAIGFVGAGVVRKFPIREFSYVSSWAIAVIDPVSFESSFNVQSAVIGSYVEYVFWGTGVSLTGLAQTAASNFTVSINGSSVLTGFTTTLIQTSTGNTFTPATGVFAGTPAAQNKYRISISGMSLGLHRIRITQNTAATGLYFDGLDVITPIHINESNLKVGSQSLLSLDKYDAVKETNGIYDASKAKAWVVFDAVTNKITSSFNVSAVLRVSAGFSIVYFEKPFKSENYVAAGMNNNWHIALNGTRKANFCPIITANSSHAGTDDAQTMVVFFGELIDEE